MQQARQRQEARLLEELHADLSEIKKVRDDALDKLKRERQLQATKVRCGVDRSSSDDFWREIARERACI